MKRIISVSMGLMFCFFSAQAALADVEGESTAHVNVLVNPNISMAASGSDIDLDVQTGLVTGTTRFQVDANSQYVSFEVTCTDLFKANDVRSEVLPIEVNAGAGSMIDPDFGIGRNVPLVAEAYVNEFPGWASAVEVFESSQNGHFSQEVSVSCTWDQDDPEKPEGDYSGWVKLVGMLSPDGGTTTSRP
jgi:hypothetical protein